MASKVSMSGSSGGGIIFRDTFYVKHKDKDAKRLPVSGLKVAQFRDGTCVRYICVCLCVSAASVSACVVVFSKKEKEMRSSTGEREGDSRETA